MPLLRLLLLLLQRFIECTLISDERKRYMLDSRLSLTKDLWIVTEGGRGKIF